MAFDLILETYRLVYATVTFAQNCIVKQKFKKCIKYKQNPNVNYVHCKSLETFHFGKCTFVSDHATS